MIKVEYYGTTTGVADSDSVAFDTVYVTTNETGRFKVAGKWILTVPHLMEFDGIKMEVVHPFYLSQTEADKLYLSRANVTPERCKNLKTELVRLEDMLARGEQKMGSFFGYRGYVDYFLQFDSDAQMIDRDRAYSYWRSLTERWPENKSVVEKNIRGLTELFEKER